MLCDKCHAREAIVKITTVVNGKSEVHNLCSECASPFHLNKDDPQEAEWSKAIFKLLTDVVMGKMNAGESRGDDEKLNSITCPTCGKSYGEYQEDGLLGCGDCYEAFASQLESAVMSIQGADTHTGKKQSRRKKPVRKMSEPVNTELTKEEEISILQMKLEEALSIEDFESAAKYRDEIRRLKEAEGE